MADAHSDNAWRKWPFYPFDSIKAIKEKKGWGGRKILTFLGRKGHLVELELRDGLVETVTLIMSK